MKAVDPEHIDATHCSQIADREGSSKILLLPLFAKSIWSSQCFVL